MSRSYQVEYDESELMDELNELDEEIVNEQLGDHTLNVPSYVPKQQVVAQGPAKPAQVISEEEQLKNLMHI